MIILKLFAIIFGVLLVLWGRYQMKKENILVGKSQRKNNIFYLLLMGEASGLGQFLGGIIMILIGVVSLFIK
ncbi:hypothetical protein G9F71_002690 [Clostridium sp. FP2]|uniref:hypothetical protein n=1 Tax=Clostridium TaxID=1485 RepID=UPI00191E6823|nr:MULTISPECIES: hypothetical protein [Clostridium]MBW9155464.1 hypothetical protein [Clostridium tagluense]MBZ9621774.1 hypothetical protein [Clostridium sp. FP2]WLC66095.1 hypothetical protein KTC93_02295 [Clostridium tagluense]